MRRHLNLEAMPAPTITCREFVDFLDDYVDGALPAPRRGCFEEHLSECPDCVRYLASYRTTVRVARAACAEPDAPPADAPPELVRAILAARRR